MSQFFANNAEINAVGSKGEGVRLLEMVPTLCRLHCFRSAHSTKMKGMPFICRS
jgi:hypothetical protein